MSNIETIRRWWIVALAATLVGLVLVGGPAEAKATKADVCHAEGNGSYHLISISERAVPKHLDRHGDGLVGGGVIGLPGFWVDATCVPFNTPPIAEDAIFEADETAEGWPIVGTYGDFSEPDEAFGDVASIAGADVPDGLGFDELTGEITVVDDSMLDFDAQPFQVVVTVADIAGLTDTATIDVFLSPLASELVFALAYTDYGADGYEPGADVLIAKVVDGNGSGALDVGDLLIVGSYPTTLTPVDPVADHGAFLGGPFTIETVRLEGSGTIVRLTVVGAGIDVEFRFRTAPPGFRPIEFFSETSPGFAVEIMDRFGARGLDSLTVLSTSELAPAGSVGPVGRSSLVDDSFIDVEVDLAGLP